MTCAKTMFVTNVSFNGINHTPKGGTAMIKLGGQIESEGMTDNAGRYFGAIKMEPSEVEFEIANKSDFVADNYRGQCSDLMFMTRDGVSYLCTNSRVTNSIELKDGAPEIKLSFKGDVAVVF
jgi:hypothetical protein